MQQNHSSFTATAVNINQNLLSPYFDLEVWGAFRLPRFTALLLFCVSVLV